MGRKTQKNPDVGQYKASEHMPLKWRNVHHDDPQLKDAKPAAGVSIVHKPSVKSPNPNGEDQPLSWAGLAR